MVGVASLADVSPNTPMAEEVILLFSWPYSSVTTSSVNLAASLVLLICTSSLLVNNLESVDLASFPMVIASLPFLEIASVNSVDGQIVSKLF